MTYVISKHTHAHTNDGPDIIFAYKPQKNKSLGDGLAPLPFLLLLYCKGKSRKLALFELSAYLSVIYWKIHKSLGADCGHTLATCVCVCV